MGNELAAIRNGRETEKRNKVDKNEKEETGQMSPLVFSVDGGSEKEPLPVFRLRGRSEPLVTFYGKEQDDDVSDRMKFDNYFQAILYAGANSLVGVGKAVGSGKTTVILPELVIADEGNMRCLDALIDKVEARCQIGYGSHAVKNGFGQYAAVVKSDDRYILLVGMWYGLSEPYKARVCCICDNGVTISKDVKEIARRLFEHFIKIPTDSTV